MLNFLIVTCVFLQYSVYKTYLNITLCVTVQPLCACFGGSVAPEDDEVGKEEALLRDEYLTFMDRCVNQCTGKTVVSHINLQS